MEIIYILTVIWLLTSTMLIKKSDKKQNLLLSIALSIIIFTSYNVFISFIFLIINIKLTILALSVVNILVSGIITYLIYRKKEIQKYTVKKIDIVYLIILLVVIVGIAIFQYGIIPKIKYETTDPAIHFNSARNFYDKKQLSWNAAKCSAFVNTEILFDTFDFIIGEENFYYLYIMFDLKMLYLIGAVLYLGITDKINDVKKIIIAMIFSIIFVLGYPLNTVIFGFQYLTLAVVYMTAIISVGIYIKNKEINLTSTCLLFFLLNFGLFFAYYLFVPMIYLGIGIYMIFDMAKGQNIKSTIKKEDIIKGVAILVIPSILGFCYFILPSILKHAQTIIERVAIGDYTVNDGNGYRDLYSNFVFLLPFVVYYIVYNIKNRKNSLSAIISIISIVFTAFWLARGLKGEVSSYYYFKIYFLLSILLYYISMKAMLLMIDNKNEIYVYSFSTILVILLIIAFTGADFEISKINLRFNPKNGINSYASIYVFNQKKIKEGEDIYNNNQLDAIKYLLKEAKDDKTNILIVGNELQMLWANSVWRITDEKTEKELRAPRELDIQAWLNNDKKKYLIYFDTSKQIEKETEKYKAIYDTEDAVILEKK